MPIGDTSRRKVLRYQQTARNVLNRGVGRPAPQWCLRRHPILRIHVRPAFFADRTA
jgi:hypothetical protein